MIVLALTAALVGPYFIDWTNYRADFEREASAILGRNVSVNGAAEARLLPFPSVTFSDVVVGGGANGEPAMTVEHFSMDAELAPFLRGEFLIFDMRMDKPHAVVSVREDGSVDWAVRPSTPIDASRISLESLTVTNGTVEIRHAPSGRTHRLSDIDLSISARSLAGPWRVDGTAKADGLATTLSVSTGRTAEDGSMRVRVRAEPERPALSLDADGNVTLSAAGMAYAGTFRLAESVPQPPTDRTATAQARTKPPAYRVTGDFRLDARRLAIPQYRFETGPFDDPYTADGDAVLAFDAAPRFDVKATGAQVRFDEAAGADTGSALSLDERWEALRQALLAVPQPSIPGTVDIELPAIVVGDTTIRDVRLAAEPDGAGWQIRSLAATMPGRTTLEADGRLTTQGGLGFDGKLLMAVRQPSGFAAWVAKDIDEAIRRLPSAGFSARVALSERRQLFHELELVLGASRFVGEIDRRRPDTGRASVFLKLEGGALDPDGAAAFASLFVSGSGASRFAGSDVDLQVKAGPVSVGGATAATVDAALRLRGDGLEVDRFSVTDLAGASIAATASFKDLSTAPSGTMDASVTAQDLGPLMALLRDRLGDVPAAAALVDRMRSHPDRLRDARIDLVGSTALDGQKARGLALSLQGEIGSTSLSVSLSSADVAHPGAANASLVVSARDPDSGRLLALAGLPVLPIETLGSGEFSIEARGVPADGLETRAELKAEQFDALFDGQAQLVNGMPTAKGKAMLTTQDVEPWLMALGVALPGMGLGTSVELAGDVDAGDGVLVVGKIDGAVNETAFSGDLNAAIDQGRPVLSGALTVDDVALDPLAAMLFGEAAFAPAEDGGWQTAPFAAAAAIPFGADLNIVTATLTAGDYAVYDAAFDLHVGLDGLAIENASAKLFDGAAKGRLVLRPRAGTATLEAQVDLQGADASQLAGPAVTGTMDLSAEATAEGKSVAALVSSLTGSGRVAGRNIAVAGLNAAAFPQLLGDADNAGRDIDAAKVAVFAPPAIRQGSFELGAFEAAFAIASGVLRAPPVNVATDAASLAIDLRADLVPGTVEAKGTIAFAAGDESIAGLEPSARFTLSGPIDAPVLGVDTEPLAQFFTQRALEKEQARVEAMQAVLLERQRLRREVRYYAALQAERDRQAEEARRAEEEARRRAEEEAAAKAAAEAAARAEEAARLAAEDAAAKAEEARRAQEAARAAEEARRKAEEERSKQEQRGDLGNAAPLTAGPAAPDVGSPVASKPASAESAAPSATGTDAGEAPTATQTGSPVDGTAAAPLPTDAGSGPSEAPRVSGEEAARAAMEVDAGLRAAQQRSASPAPQPSKPIALPPPTQPQWQRPEEKRSLFQTLFPSLGGP